MTPFGYDSGLDFLEVFIVKNYVHARLGAEDRAILKELKKVTGQTESALVKEGLLLVYQKKVKKPISALELAGDAVGCIASGIPDLSTNKKHFEGFGE